MSAHNLLALLQQVQVPTIGLPLLVISDSAFSASDDATALIGINLAATTIDNLFAIYDPADGKWAVMNLTAVS